MARTPSMDPIKAPDMNNLNKKQSDAINKFDRYSRAEDHSGMYRAGFDKATAMKDFEVEAQKPKKDEVEVMLEEFEPKRKPTVAASRLNKGVKVHGKYVARKRILTAIITLVVIFAAVMVFAPPIFMANDSESSCRYEDIFADKGVTAYRAEIMENNSVYNIDALSSDLSDSYRICTVAFDVNNYTMFTAKLDNYAITGGGDYADHIVFLSSAIQDVEIPAFTKKTVKIDILINRNGLTDEQFDDAITSLTIRTNGMKKHVAKSVYIPCIPSWMGVSNVISFDPDAK